MNKDGRTHRLLGPAAHRVDRVLNTWLIDGVEVTSWSVYEQLSAGRVSKEMIAQLKAKHGETDDAFKRS